MKKAGSKHQEPKWGLGEITGRLMPSSQWPISLLPEGHRPNGLGPYGHQPIDCDTANFYKSGIFVISINMRKGLHIKELKLTGLNGPQPIKQCPAGH